MLGQQDTLSGGHDADRHWHAGYGGRLCGGVRLIIHQRGSSGSHHRDLGRQVRQRDRDQCPLALADSTISGTFNTGDSQGTVSGIYSSATFTIQLAATSGTHQGRPSQRRPATQRTLSDQQLINVKKRITAHWNDGGGGLRGEMSLAAPGSTPCP